jgi:hypothetical protein
MRPIFAITLRCAHGHTQVLHVEGMTRAAVEDYAGLLAGRSPYFLVPIPDDAVGSETDRVGFCMCGARIAAPEIAEGWA